MAILDVATARTVTVIKRGMSPRLRRVENELRHISGGPRK
jgi:hypothetical protein